MKIKVGVSNRHVHLSKEHLEILFGKDYELTKKKDLSQTGEFAANEVVTVQTDKASLTPVRVLGPVRPYTQVEISKTDAYKLGVNPPVRNSGDLENSVAVTLIGPCGQVDLQEGCILATRHVHLSFEDSKRLHLDGKKETSVLVSGPKGGILYHVHLKRGENYCLELHLDTDDANAFGIVQGDEVELLEEEQ